jgi:hypothetical protein
MNLLHLAPDIQEELLFLLAAESGRESIHEKLLRPVAAEMDWQEQRAIWAKLTRGESYASSFEGLTISPCSGIGWYARKSATLS